MLLVIAAPARQLKAPVVMTTLASIHYNDGKQCASHQMHTVCHALTRCFNCSLADTLLQLYPCSHAIVYGDKQWGCSRSVCRGSVNSYLEYSNAAFLAGV